MAGAHENTHHQACLFSTGGVLARDLLCSHVISNHMPVRTSVPLFLCCAIYVMQLSQVKFCELVNNAIDS